MKKRMKLKLSFILVSSLIIILILSPTPFVVSQSEVDLVPLSIHQWDKTMSFALLDIDTTDITSPTVQLITNNISLVEPSTIINTINNFMSSEDNNPSKTLAAYSSWYNIFNPTETSKDVSSSFQVTATFPFLRTIIYKSPFPNVPSFNLSHYAIGMPSMLSTFESPHNHSLFFKQSFLGLIMKIYNNTDGTNISSQQEQPRFLPSYLVTNSNLLQIFNETIGILGANVPSVITALPLIQVQKNSFTYIINNPILVFQENVPEEVVPLTSIYYPTSPEVIMFSKNLTLTFFIKPYFSPLGAHLIINTEITLSPIEWLLIREQINERDFNNVTRVTLPSLFNPLNRFPNTNLDFIFYHEKIDIEKRLSHPLYPQIDLSYALGLQLISINYSSQQNVFESITPTIDGKINNWEINERDHSISSNITYSFSQENGGKIRSTPIIVIPTITESLSFNETKSSKNSSQSILDVDRITTTRWNILNPQFFTSLNPNQNPYLNYFLENQQSYFVEALIASINARVTSEQASTLSRSLLLEKLKSLVSEQLILDITMDNWNGEGFIHQTRSDLIHKLNTTTLEFGSNEPRETGNGSSIVSSFSFSLTLYTSMLLAITYIIKKKKRLTR